MLTTVTPPRQGPVIDEAFFQGEARPYCGERFSLGLKPTNENFFSDYKNSKNFKAFLKAENFKARPVLIPGSTSSSLGGGTVVKRCKNEESFLECVDKLDFQDEKIEL